MDIKVAKKKLTKGIVTSSIGITMGYILIIVAYVMILFSAPYEFYEDMDGYGYHAEIQPIENAEDVSLGLAVGGVIVMIVGILHFPVFITTLVVSISKYRRRKREIVRLQFERQNEMNRQNSYGYDPYMFYRN